jgi:hypothetical protein
MEFILSTTSEVAFEGENGKVAFTKVSPRSEEGRIVAVSPDGCDLIPLGSGFSPSYVFKKGIGTVGSQNLTDPPDI